MKRYALVKVQRPLIVSTALTALMLTAGPVRAAMGHDLGPPADAPTLTGDHETHAHGGDGTRAHIAAASASSTPSTGSPTPSAPWTRWPA